MAIREIRTMGDEGLTKKGKEVIENYQDYLPKFKKIIPIDYKEMMQVSAEFEEQGFSKEEAQIEAFYACTGGERA